VLLKARKEFLEEYDKLGFVTNQREARILVMQHVLKYSFFFVSLLVILSVGAMVYADRADVPYNHPLYSLKKANENIQVQLASPADAPDLYNRLAQRRIDEMNAIQSDPGQDNQSKVKNIKALSLDLEQEIDNALIKLDAVKDQKSNPEEEKKLCKSIATIIENHRKIITQYAGQVDFNEDYSVFNKQCSKLLEPITIN
jgi:hypothetical protein